MNKKVFLSILILPTLALSGCAQEVTDSTGVYSLFGTSSFDIRLYKTEKSKLDYLVNYFTSLSNEIDAYTEPSNGAITLYSVNHTNEPVKVSQQLFDILTFAIDMQKESEGWLNPFLGNITTLWKEKVVDAKDPTASDVAYVESQLPSLLAETNNTSITFDESNLTVTRNGTGTIDLGALGKGYSLREAKRYLEEQKVTAYLINGGSSSMIFGTTKAGADWKINFKDCQGAYFTASNTGIGTSSLDEQAAVVDGKTYTHIVNPFTGSALSTYTMCTIRSDDPGLDDVFSTVFMVAGVEKADYFVSKIEKDFGIHMSYAFYTKGTDTWNTSSDMEVTLP